MQARGIEEVAMFGSRWIPTLLVATLSLGLLASACADDQPTVQGGGSGDDGEDAGEGHSEQGRITVGGVPATNHGTEDVSAESSFELEIDDFYFGPTVLEGGAGQELTLALHNEGEATHTFTIDGGPDETLEAGDEGVSVDVTFPQSGAIVFYCQFHRGGGMVGGLSAGGSLDAVATGSGSDTGTGSDTEGPGYGAGYGG